MTRLRRTLGAAGLLVLGYAITGALTDRDLHAGALLFLAAVLLLHDAVILPLTLLTAAAVDRWCPTALRAYLKGALLCGAAVTVVALPPLIGAGRAADNPSLLPGDYDRGLLCCYAVIVLTTTATAALTHRRATRSRRSPPDR